MAADPTRELREALDKAGYTDPVLRLAFTHGFEMAQDAQQADDPSGPGVDAAWEALRDEWAASLAKQSYNLPMVSADKFVARHRPLIEAAIRGEWERLRLTRERTLELENDALRVAIRAASPGPEPVAGLDVERLAEALHRLDNVNGHDYTDPSHRAAHDADAVAIAREYSALGEKP